MTTALRVASVVLVVVAGAAACSVPGEDVALDRPDPSVSVSASAGADGPATSPVPSAPATSAEAASPSPAPKPTPVVKTVTGTRSIGFSVRTVRDGSLDEGVRRVRTQGRNGIEQLTYKVTYVDGRRTDRDLVGRKVTRRPVAQVIVIGTREDKPRCDPNYGGCVPIAADVDCAGGSGNGPAYVRGPVEVTGTDIYDLDRDGDGTACD